MPKNYKNKEEVNKEYVDLVRNFLLNNGFPTDNLDKNVEDLEVTLSTEKNAVGQYINVSLYKAIDKIKIFQGDLVAFDGETLTIDYLDKTRHKTVEIPYQTVAKARLAVKL